MTSVGDVLAILGVVVKTAAYLSDVHKASEERREFKDRAELLLKTVHQLQAQSARLDSENRGAAGDIIKHLHVYLTRLNSQLEKERKRLKNVATRFLWPRQKTQFKESFEAINQFNNQLQTVLAHANFRQTTSLLAENHVKRVSTLFEKLTPKQADDLRRKPPRLGKLTDQTCDWVFDEAEVKKWLSSENGLLWVHGIQGSGKTGFITILGDKLFGQRDDRDNTSVNHVARVYCDHQTLATLESSMDIIMSLWIQVARSSKFTLDPSALEELETRLGIDLSGINGDTEKEKMHLFSQTIAHGGNTVLVVDGLDEVPRYLQADLVGHLKDLHQRNRQCRIVVTSRPYRDIQNMFEGDPKFGLAASTLDIELYARDRIRRLNQTLFFNQAGIVEYIVDSLKERCKNSFLLAKLLMDEVMRATTIDECRRIVKHLPYSIHDAYKRGLERLSEEYNNLSRRDGLPCYAIQALFWVAFVSGPMEERQLKQALAVGIEDADYNQEKEMSEAIDKISGELLIVDPVSGEVRVAHKSITDYLRQDDTRQHWFPNIREHIPITLMHYLRFPCMMRQNEMVKISDVEFSSRHPLAGYAIKNWGRDLNDILKPDTPVWRATQRFVQAPSDQWNDYIRYRAKETVLEVIGYDLLSHNGEWNSFDIHGLHWVVYFELVDFIPILAAHEKLFPINNCHRLSPMLVAAAGNKKEILKRLIEAGIDVNVPQKFGRAPWQPLYFAVISLSFDAAALLLESGADMTLRHSDGQSAADFVCYSNRKKLALIFAKAILGRNPTKAQELQLLVHVALKDELKRAIEEGLDVNHPCENGKNALDYANELGNQDIIDILAANKATARLCWPPFMTDSSPYPQNIPESWVDGPEIIYQKAWRVDELASVSRHAEVEPVMEGSETVAAPSEAVIETLVRQDYSFWEPRLLLAGYSFFLLEVPIDRKIELPVRRIVFEFVSKQSHGEDTSRFYISATNGEGAVQTYDIQYHMSNSKTLKLHTSIWDLDDLEVSNPGKASFMRNIQYGSRLEILFEPGYRSLVHIGFVRARVFGTQGTVISLEADRGQGEMAGRDSG